MPVGMRVGRSVKHRETGPSASDVSFHFTRSVAGAQVAAWWLAPVVKPGEGVLALTLALSILIGVSLGVLGGGGSILTVPILSYVVGMAPKAAIASSLVVVTITSVVGVIPHARAGRVMWRTGVWFGGAGMVGAFVGARLSVLFPARALMIAFGVMMVLTAIAMFRRASRRPQIDVPWEAKLGLSLLQGFLVGTVTGLLGVGGGFLIVPAMVLLGGIAMECAVGTSLVVIAMNSLAGSVGHLGDAHIDWPITLVVSGVAAIGAWLGGRLVGRIDPTILRRTFGVLIIIVAAVVLVKELGF